MNSKSSSFTSLLAAAVAACGLFMTGWGADQDDIRAGLAAAAEDPAYPPPAAPSAAELAGYGVGIQRTMTLLATSTPQNRHCVRLLFYGQSITASPWWQAVVADLKARFPNADLEVENRAIGGFEAPALIRTAEHDLYPFYPDLLLFHVYGGDKTGELERILASVRQRTTAEILIRTAHVSRDPNAHLEQAAKIRELAATYGCELVDVRTSWEQYLTDNRLQPANLLFDNVHLNAQGLYVMAELVMRHLRYDARFPKESWAGLVSDVTVADSGPARRLADGTIELRFDGNRVDVVPDPTARPPFGSASVVVDERPPSAFPEAYAVTRPSTALGWWPAIMQVGHEKPLVTESWVLRIVEMDDEASDFRFEVAGSVTGPDGSGSCKTRFVSDSGRVAIEPEDWMVKKPVPVGFEIKWTVVPLHADTYRPPEMPDPAREYPTTLVQGIANGPHVLRLTPVGDGPLPIAGFRVYRPPQPGCDTGSRGSGHNPIGSPPKERNLASRRIDSHSDCRLAGYSRLSVGGSRRRHARFESLIAGNGRGQTTGQFSNVFPTVRGRWRFQGIDTCNCL